MVRDLSLLHTVQTGSWTHTTPGALPLRVKQMGHNANHLHQVVWRLRMRGTMCPILPHVLMVYIRTNLWKSGGIASHILKLYYYYYYYYYYYLLQLSFHSVAVALTLVTNKNKHI